MMKKSLILLFGLTLSLSFWLTLIASTKRVGQEEYAWGIFQGDMPTYLANARSTSERTFHLTYSNPYDLNVPKHDYLIQLPITLLSVLLKIGFTESQTNMVITLFFGSLMFLALYYLVSYIIENSWVKNILFLLLSVGGGLAWLSSLADGGLGFWDGIALHELNYYWWFFNVFRNLLYPFELIHHTLFLFYVLSLTQKKWRNANILLSISLFINPFLALHMVLLHFLTAFFETSTHWAKKISSAPLVLIWVIYYSFFLPRVPEIKSLIEQHGEAFSSSMSLNDFLQAYGFSIIALFAIFDKNFYQKMKSEWKIFPIFLWAIITLVLLENSHIPYIKPIQPLHFGRGYLYIALWTILFKWIEISLDLKKLKPKFVQILTVFFLVCSLPDNISFVKDLYTKKSRRLFVWDEDREKLLRFIGDIPGPKHFLIYDDDLCKQVPAKFSHHVFHGTQYTTPNFNKRMSEIHAFLNSGGDFKESKTLEDWGLDYVIVPHWTGVKLRPDSWKKVWNDDFCLIYQKM